MKPLLLTGLFGLVFSEWVGDQHVLQSIPSPIQKSVAIIGGGAAGTSTAFWLNSVFPKDKISITLYEKTRLLGGRSTTVAIKDNATAWGMIELGASIFVEANKNLMKATDVFQLKRTDLTSESKKGRPGLGIWDGKEFLYEETGTYWDKITPIWRYGVLSPLKFQRKQRNVVEQFLKLYDADHGFENIAKIVEKLQFNELMNQTAIDYLKHALGINDRFSFEVLQSATRGNYCQDLNQLHAFALMVSMEAGNGVWAVEDGNFRIFEEFAYRSGADIQLETEVTAIFNITEPDEFGNLVRRYVVETSDGTSQIFDEVVMATPLASSGINFNFPVTEQHRDYHVVHVTLVAGHVNYSHFGKENLDTMPTFVITTGYPLVQHFENGSAPFQTFSAHRYLDNGEDVVKIFSSDKLSEEELDGLFLNKSWVYHKEWHAFPELHPITGKNKFPHFILKASKDEQEGIIYTGAFENFISTMETQTVSGKNAARLLYDKWCRERHCQPFGDGWGSH
ncbi:hypothetical protein G6F37_006174 [Rhizopus arrhizus]|nr:hypothetical protein G6F38_006250 [Rhizopus arrhizus]KAG1158022.1 hypothetical protein G6F37_006174 [Rhizopus arrhizus]